MDDNKLSAKTYPASAAMTEQHERGPFAALGRFTIRFRYLIVVGWLVATVLSVKLLPSLASVASGSNTTFLPASAPSVQAGKLAGPCPHGSLPTAIPWGTPAHPVPPAHQLP